MLTNTEVKVMAWKLVPVPSRTLIEIQHGNISGSTKGSTKKKCTLSQEEWKEWSGGKYYKD